MPAIRIDGEVYSWLKSQAVPFDDTPNSVLRRLAGLDKKPSLIRDTATSDDNKNNEESADTLANVKSNQALPRKLTGKYLARLWKVNVRHALYHKDGSYYGHLLYFPGALFDTYGYVIFHTEKEYLSSPYLQHGQQLNVPGGIARIPSYKKMK